MLFRRRYRLLLLLPILLILLNAWLAWQAIDRLFTAQQWLAHTLEVERQADELESNAVAATSAARGYLLSESPAFTLRYEQAKREVSDDITHLQVLTADNPSQQRRIRALRQRTAVRFEALGRAMRASQQLPHVALAPELVQPVLQESPDGGITLKYAIAQIRQEEDRLLAGRYRAARSARRAGILTFALASTLDVVLLVLAFWQLVRMVRSREQLAERSEQITLLNGELSLLNAGLEQRVEERTRELEVSNQELQAFSYSVSHDLRAPLRTIDGFSLALEEDFAEVLNAEGRDYIRRVRAGVQRMGTLIDALLQLSRVTRSEVQREQVDLSQLATLVFGELMANEQERVVDFTVQEGLVAEADPRLMRVAFENLLGNAIKFTSKTEHPRIAFGASQDDAEAVYFVRDNGAGFDMQYVDRLFTAFQRLHGDRDFKGSGIGLATVSRIVRRHHGRIWAEATPGTGATFSFTLNG